MQRETKFIQLPDGRALAFGEYGDPKGAPAIYCHGFPGSHLEAELFDNEAHQNRIRVIAADRNGLGQSDPKPGRRLMDWSADIAALADHLNLDRFHLIGVSGGGPYAVACAHQLADRIERLTLVCPLGELEKPNLFKAMQWPAQINFRSILMTPWLSHLTYQFAVIPFARIWPEWIYQLMIANVPEVDKKVLIKTSVRSVILDSLLEAIRQGAAGILDEMALYTQPWDLDLSEIHLPVHLWHGLADKTVPVIHGRTLARQLPNCETHYIEGEGHFSLPFGRMQEILGKL